MQMICLALLFYYTYSQAFNYSILTQWILQNIYIQDNYHAESLLQYTVKTYENSTTLQSLVYIYS